MAEMEYFCCFNSYLKKTRNLSDSELGRLFRALMTYNATGEKAQLNGREETAFDFISEDIDAAKEKYAARCEQNKVNRTKQTSTTVNERQPSSTTVNERDQTKNKKQKTKDNIEEEEDAREALSSCVTCYEQNIGSLPRYVADQIIAYLQEFPPEVICAAIEEAAANNARNWNYISAVLKNCHDKNIRTLDAFRMQSSEHRARRAPTAPGAARPHKKTAQEEFLEMARGGATDEQAADSSPFGGSDNLLAEY